MATHWKPNIGIWQFFYSFFFLFLVMRNFQNNFITEFYIFNFSFGRNFTNKKDWIIMYQVMYYSHWLLTRPIYFKAKNLYKRRTCFLLSFADEGPVTLFKYLLKFRSAFGGYGLKAFQKTSHIRFSKCLPSFFSFSVA
jgi:hypothetical protein